MDKHDKKHNPQQDAEQDKKDQGATKVADEQNKDKDPEKSEHDQKADKIGNFDA